MATPLELVIDPIVSTHAFFTTYVGASVSVADKRRLATKLLLYEIRGRPWDSEAVDLKRFSGEWTRFTAKPQLPVVVNRLKGALDRYAAGYSPWVAGEPVFKRHREFPGVYWGMRWVSTSQLAYARDLVLAFYGLPSPVTLPAAKVNRYTALRATFNVGYANHDRALMLMAENSADMPYGLPEEALVVAATF